MIGENWHISAKYGQLEEASPIDLHLAIGDPKSSIHLNWGKSNTIPNTL